MHLPTTDKSSFSLFSWYLILDEAVENAEKNGDSHLDPDLIEIVFKNVILDSEGNPKVNPRHVLTDPKIEELSPNVDSTDDVLSFLKELDISFLSDQMKTKCIFVTRFGCYLSFFKGIKKKST